MHVVLTQHYILVYIRHTLIFMKNPVKIIKTLLKLAQLFGQKIFIKSKNKLRKWDNIKINTCITICYSDP